MNTTTDPGNATSERSVVFTYAPHGDNQIASDSGHYSWAYDGDGNPITYLSKTNAFDPENRMTAYAIPTGGGHATLTMGYDDDGMRAWKENSSSTRTYFLYDGSDLIAELTSAGALGTYQTVGIDGVVSRRAGITTTYFAFDPEGSVSAVLNYTGTVRGDELFEANGRRDGSYSDRPVDFGGQWGYYGDSETGLTLLGHRYYDSYAGRFLTRDPIRYNGGVNLYSYTANDFENRADPKGLEPRTGESGGQVINYSSHNVPVIFDTYDNGRRYEYMLYVPPGYETQPNNVDVDFVPGNFNTWRHIPGYHDGWLSCSIYDFGSGYAELGIGLPTLKDNTGWPKGYGNDPKYTMSFSTAVERDFIKPIPTVPNPFVTQHPNSWP